MLKILSRNIEITSIAVIAAITLGLMLSPAQRTLADEVRGLVYYVDSTGKSTKITPVQGVNYSAGQISSSRVDSSGWGFGYGDVVGPASATKRNFALFDSTTGKLLADYGVDTLSFDQAGAAASVQSNLDTHTVLTTSAHGGIVADSDARLSDARMGTGYFSDTTRAKTSLGLGTAAYTDTAAYMASLLSATDSEIAVFSGTDGRVLKQSGEYLSSFVKGPAACVSTAIPRWSGTTGKLLQCYTSNPILTTDTGYATFQMAPTSNMGSDTRWNEAWGALAGRSMGGGSACTDNTAVGGMAMYTTTTGSNNCAFGFGCLYSNFNGIGNTAGGVNCMYANTGSAYNSAWGNEALRNHTSGDDNSAFGRSALNADTAGTFNTGAGSYALASTTRGISNSALGYNSLSTYLAGASYNTGCGAYSLYNLSYGQYNSALGYQTLRPVPAAPAGSRISGGSVDNSTHVWFVSHTVNGLDVLSAGRVLVMNVGSGLQSASLTSLPTYTGPFTVTGRKIWRTAAGAPSSGYYLVANISLDTDSFVDTESDATVMARGQFTSANDVNSTILIGANAAPWGSNQCVLGNSQNPINDVYLGGVHPHAVGNGRQITVHSMGGYGTNKAGGDLIVAAGQGTGSGVAGRIILQTSVDGVGGTSLIWNTLDTAMVIDSDAVNVTRQFVSTLAGGTSPFSVSSSTLNLNLNADLLDGTDSSGFASAGHGHSQYVAGGTDSVDSGIAIYSGTSGRLLKNNGLNFSAPSGKFLRDNGTWDTPAGAGDVVGGLTSVDSEIVVYSGTGGKTIKQSGLFSSSFAAANHNQSAATITTGNLDTARLPTGGAWSPSSDLTIQAKSGSAKALTLKGSISADNNTQLRFHGVAYGGEIWAVGSAAATSDSTRTFDIVDLVASSTVSRLRIDGSGYVGVGTNAPSAALHVKGDGTGMKLESSADIWWLLPYDGGSGLSDFRLWNDTDRLNVTADNGYVGIGVRRPSHLLQLAGGAYCDGSGDWITGSDLGYKRDVKNYSSGLDAVMAMRPVTYIHKQDKADKKQVGFIAQELEKIIPEVVDGEEGGKGIAYGKLTPALVNAIKEQQTQIEDLKARLEKLERK